MRGTLLLCSASPCEAHSLRSCLTTRQIKFHNTLPGKLADCTLPFECSGVSSTNPPGYAVEGDPNVAPPSNPNTPWQIHTQIGGKARKACDSFSLVCASHSLHAASLSELFDLHYTVKSTRVEVALSRVNQIASLPVLTVCLHGSLQNVYVARRCMACSNSPQTSEVCIVPPSKLLRSWYSTILKRTLTLRRV